MKRSSHCLDMHKLEEDCYNKSKFIDNMCFSPTCVAAIDDTDSICISFSKQARFERTSDYVKNIFIDDIDDIGLFKSISSLTTLTASAASTVAAVTRETPINVSNNVTPVIVVPTASNGNNEQWSNCLKFHSLGKRCTYTINTSSPSESMSLLVM